VSAAVAAAVASATVSDDVAGARIDEPVRQVHDSMWRPEYPALDLKPA
jgi:hypothetical protein